MEAHFLAKIAIRNASELLWDGDLELPIKPQNQYPSKMQWNPPTSWHTKAAALFCLKRLWDMAKAFYVLLQQKPKHPQHKHTTRRHKQDRLSEGVCGLLLSKEKQENNQHSHTSLEKPKSKQELEYASRWGNKSNFSSTPQQGKKLRTSSMDLWFLPSPGQQLHQNAI